jgi:AcrR family transcriptional regulator
VAQQGPKPTTAGTRAPRGVEAVRAALVAAAAELLLTHTPAQISGRMIAERANVNYGLIHQYFGSKSQIFRTVFLDVSERVTAEAKRADPGWWNRPELFSTRGDLWRIVANLVADPDLVLEMGWEFPLMRTIAAQIQAEHPEWELRMVQARAAAIGSALLGWALLESTFQRGLDLSPDELFDVRNRVFEIVTRS